MTRQLPWMLLFLLASPAFAQAPSPILANDNRTPAGTLRSGVLTVQLAARSGRWYPEADDGPSLQVQAHRTRMVRRTKRHLCGHTVHSGGPMNAKLLTEGIGTFFLVLTVGLTVLAGVDAAPLAIGAVLMVMVYMGGHVSGAHYNPAVTLAVLLRGKIDTTVALAYMVVQLIAAMAAAAVTSLLMGNVLVPAPSVSAAPLQVILVEVLFTFALCLVVLNVATSRKTDGNSHYGLAIGFTVMVGAYAGGGISGGAFNPAVGAGPALVSALMGQGLSAAVVYYLIGPFLGGALAALAFRVQQPEEFVPAPAPLAISVPGLATEEAERKAVPPA